MYYFGLYLDIAEITHDATCRSVYLNVPDYAALEFTLSWLNASNPHCTIAENERLELCTQHSNMVRPNYQQCLDAHCVMNTQFTLTNY